MANVRLLIASTNPHKVREIRQLLADAPADLIGLSDLPAVPEPDETGSTFQENARLKALYYSRHAASGSMLVAADDSGLIVDALDGEPGVTSARFVRADASYPERFDEIYRRLARLPDAPRTARFVCAVAVAHGEQVIFETTGVVEGEITAPPRGTAGFGYDPIFFYPPYGRTLAEVGADEKNRVAHRGHAFRQLSDWLRTGAAPHVNPEF